MITHAGHDVDIDGACWAGCPGCKEEQKMPYIIINDRDCNNVHYYTGQGFCRGIDTTVEEISAKRLPMTEAVSVMRGRADLYAAGWRFVPVTK